MSTITAVSKPPRRSSIHTAAATNDLEGVSALLQDGVPVDSLDAKALTSLMHAAFRGHVEMIDLLVAHRANVNARATSANYSVLMFAVMSGGAAGLGDLSASSHFSESASCLKAIIAPLSPFWMRALKNMPETRGGRLHRHLRISSDTSGASKSSRDIFRRRCLISLPRQVRALASCLGFLLHRALFIFGRRCGALPSFERTCGAPEDHLPWFSR
eukprot:m.129302 g.129302  ORF g.129302 m.129302 type:complete len:215 (+) comp52311_c0_seq2:156-800(+)